MRSDLVDIPGRTAARVLVVDDDDELRTKVRLTLERGGLDVTEAPNGRDALQIVETQPIAIVVCDLSMPGMTGLEVVQTLRTKPESSTLPFLLMTGSGDSDAVLKALAAGADDFLAKPVRPAELLARVRAHIRTGSAWRAVVETELQSRAEAVEAIGRLAVSPVPEEAAETVVIELARRTGSQFVSILQLAGGSGLRPLAKFSAEHGLVQGGPAINAAHARALLSRTNVGPWALPVAKPGPLEFHAPFWEAGLDLVAGAPIYADDTLVGILTIGVGPVNGAVPLPRRRARLLASVIDYASGLSQVAGHAIADRREIEAQQSRLRHVLRTRAFFPVFQPIVALDTHQPVGYEALSRFEDGASPQDRFDEAAAMALGPEFELATVKAAIKGSLGLHDGAFLSLNVSPELILRFGRRLGQLLAKARHSIVIEVTEHAEIADYDAFRRAFRGLGDVRLAVDDAGAGHSSLRHILELEPSFAKLDISLVQGIDGDEPRQALTAGLAYFAGRINCTLIAEGVERHGEAQALREIGVQLGQGYLFGRPERLAS
jgi:EAL domain-containing protein (putative c-di-GMP-specific phosphodiesterase class I)/DNA-binding response OmpR family regulator